MECSQYCLFVCSYYYYNYHFVGSHVKTSETHGVNDASMQPTNRCNQQEKGKKRTRCVDCTSTTYSVLTANLDQYLTLNPNQKKERVDPRCSHCTPLFLCGSSLGFVRRESSLPGQRHPWGVPRPVAIAVPGPGEMGQGGPPPRWFPPWSTRACLRLDPSRWFPLWPTSQPVPVLGWNFPGGGFLFGQREKPELPWVTLQEKGRGSAQSLAHPLG